MEVSKTGQTAIDNTITVFETDLHSACSLLKTPVVKIRELAVRNWPIGRVSRELEVEVLH